MTSAGTAEVENKDGSKAKVMKTTFHTSAKRGQTGDFSALGDLLASTVGVDLKTKNKSSSSSSSTKVTVPVTHRHRGVDSVRKALNQSEAVVLQATQILREGKGPSATRLTCQVVSDKLEAVRKRLQEDVLPIYSQGQEAGVEADGSTARGFKILKDLRDAESKLVPLKELLRLVEASDGGAGKGEVVAATARCRDAGVELHSSIDIWLVAKELDALDIASPDYKACLNPDAAACPTDRYSILALKPIVDEETLRVVQRKVGPGINETCRRLFFPLAKI